MKKSGKKKGMLVFLLLIVCVAAITFFAIGMNGSGGVLEPSTGKARLAWEIFLDIPSLLLIVLFVLPILLIAGVGKDIKNAFRIVLSGAWDCTLAQLKLAEHGIETLMKAILTAGSYAFVISIIVLLCNIRMMDGMEMGRFCANLSVAALTVFYMLALELILLPVKSILHRHVISFMEDDR